MSDAAGISRAQVEDFLYHEAALLDAWQLDAWLGLLSEDASYRVPSNDAPGSNPAEALFMIADDARRIRERVARLKDRNAHAEFPHSRTRRMISNVRIIERSAAMAADELSIEANFVVYRHRRGDDIRTYIGQYRHVLRLTGDGLRIVNRHAILDAMELGAMGLVSFIL
jgi:p-cumate 2,3-dioxygenase beta subunit